MPNLIDHSQYTPEAHAGYKKYVQIKMCQSPFGKRIPVVTWIFYADFDPNTIIKIGDALRNIDVTNYTGEISVGMAVPTGSQMDPESIVFVNQNTAYRQLHTDEELLSWVRILRGRAIYACDPLVMRHISQPENAKTLTEAQYAELQSYMQELRDFPANVDLDNIVWPTKPSFMQPINAAITPPAV